LLISRVNIAFALCSFQPHQTEEGKLIVTSPVADFLFLCTTRGASSLVAKHFPVLFRVTACVLVVKLLLPVKETANLFVIAKSPAEVFTEESGS